MDYNTIATLVTLSGLAVTLGLAIHESEKARDQKYLSQLKIKK